MAAIIFANQSAAEQALIILPLILYHSLQLFLASIFFCVFQRVIGVIIILNFGLVLTAAFRV